MWDTDLDQPRVKKQEEVEGGYIGLLQEKNHWEKEASTDSSDETLTLSCSG